MKALVKVCACVEVPHSVWTVDQLVTVTALPRTEVARVLGFLQHVGDLHATRLQTGHRGRPRHLYHAVSR